MTAFFSGIKLLSIPYVLLVLFMDMRMNMNFTTSVITGTEATAFWEVRPMIGFCARDCYQLFLVLSMIICGHYQ